MALPITDLPYRGHAPITWDTVTLKRVIDELNALGAGGGDLAGRVVARNRRTSTKSGITGSSQGSATKILDTGPVVCSANRLYQVYSPGFGVYGTVGTVLRAQITYTTDGSTPGVTSTTLDMSQVSMLAGDNVSACNIGKLFGTVANTLTCRFLLSAYLINPGGGASCAAYGANDWPNDLIVADVGVDPGASGSVF